jgi:hypothetical protein
VKGDLEAVILKAVEKDSARRYATTSELAADVRRFLRGDPVSARRPTAWSRLLRWAGRRPKTAAALGGIAIAAAIVAGTLISIEIAGKMPGSLALRLFGQLQVGPHRRGNEAALYSRMDSELFTWSTHDEGTICLAELAERPDGWGGGKVVVLGFSWEADPPHRGRLCIFDAGGPYDRPLHSLTVEQSELDALPEDFWPRPSHEPRRPYRSEGFSVKTGALIDVFTDHEHPGPEIIAYHEHCPGSQGVLRIYNLRGEVLFQAWQDGGIYNVYWLAEAGLLVCSAFKGDQDRSEHGRPIRGNHPVVLFAIRPVAGETRNGWIHPFAPGDRPRFKGDTWKGEWYRPAWYKLPCPLEWADVSASGLRLYRPNLPGFSPGRFVDVRVDRRDIKTPIGSQFEFTVIVDAKGMIEHREKLGDNGRSVADKPAHESFDLLDWDEGLARCTSSSR